MLAEKNAIATVAVKDIGIAKKFYEGVLGLKPRPTVEPSVAEYQSGNADLMVYESKFAGTNQATAVTWFVDQLENLVQTLKSKGVHFEHYNMPGVTLQGDVHLAGRLKNAWFKDPDGNILSLVSR
jgi:predicted enzyme related to lactoylglutathione lyase